MKIKAMTILFCIIFLHNIYSNIKSNIYNFLKIKTIPIGKEEGKLGYNKKMEKYGSKNGPNSFAINQENLVYVFDHINNKISIFDIKMNFIKDITGKESYYYNIKTVKFDNNNNLIIYSNGYGLTKINKDGQLIFHIPNKELPDNVKYNFFPYNDNILIYDDEMNIEYIDTKGKIKDQEKTNILLQSISSEDKSMLKSDSNIKVKIENFKNKHNDNKNFIFINDKLLISSFYPYYKEYFSMIRNNLKTNTLKDNLQVDLTKLEFNSLIGFDKQNNSYWEFYLRKEKTIYVIIYSKYGEVLDFFPSEFKPDNHEIALAPNGDVWFMSYDETGIHFWKVERRW